MTTYTLTPNSDEGKSDFGPSVSGAGTYPTDHMTDDSDSTYVDFDVSAANNPGWVKMGLTSTTLATGEIVKSAGVTWRADSSTGSSVAYFYALSGTDSKLLATQNFQSTVTEQTTAQGALDTFVGYDQTKLDDLVLQVVVNDQDTDPRLYEIELDLTTVTIPTTVVTAAGGSDPYTTGTTVPVSWVNTLDTDGGGQTHYHVIAYTDAQYGAGGFDPGGTGQASFYDSGVVQSSAVSASVPDCLDDTYRFYVRVGQTVGSTIHWSAWSHYDQFTVTVDTADIDTVTVTPADSLGRIVVYASRDTGSEAWDYFEMEKSNDGGTTWTPVRGATFVAPSFANLTGNVIDYETANGTEYLYRARATWYDSGNPITGDWVEASAAASWESTTKEFIRDVADSSAEIEAYVSAIKIGNRSSDAGVFPIIGATTPVVVSDVLRRPATYQLTYILTPTELSALDTLLAQQSTLLFVLRPESNIGPNRDGMFYGTVSNVSETLRYNHYRGGELDQHLVTLTVHEATYPVDPDASSSAENTS